MALVQALGAWDLPTTSAEGSRQYHDLARATEIARSSIFPRDITVPEKPIDPNLLREAIVFLRSASKLSSLHQDFIDSVEAKFYLVSNDLARYFTALEDSNAEPGSAQFQAIVVELFDRVYAWQRAWGMPLYALEDNRIVQQFTSQFQQLLYASLPAQFQDVLLHFLADSLAAVPVPNHDELERAGGKQKHKAVPPPSSQLLNLNIVHRYATTLMRVAFDEIEKIAAEEAEAGWEERRLVRARARVSASLVSWMSGIFEGNEALLRSIFVRFDYHLCKSFFDIRTDELFDIIVDFPDSFAALEDLRDCMFKIDQREQVVDKLKAVNVKRLLHPGAETKDVITQYISTIRCLRILDPLGVLLHKVAEPIRKHLRDRPDTIRCIVASLVQGEELQDENDPAFPEPLRTTHDNVVENFSNAKWEPEPNDAAPEFRTGRASDTVSTLVSIYETREAIVKELQSYLATRLLAIEDYDSVKELRTIELLKIRFGEEALHVCDVMLKDMSDSKRINDHVHGDIETVVQPLIISRMFWPEVPPTTFHVTPKLAALEAEYEAAFHHFKPDKHLRWLQELGTASVTIELEDRTVTANVTPLQVAVMELFDTSPQWKEDDLAKALQVEVPAARAAMGVWVGHGVLKSDEEGSWRLLEVAEGDIQRAPVTEKAPTFQRVDELQAEEKGRLWWQYIRGVLSNLGAQKLSTLQHMLSMDKDYNLSAEELAVFMAAARREGHVVERRDGTWVLPE